MFEAHQDTYSSLDIEIQFDSTTPSQVNPCIFQGVVNNQIHNTPTWVWTATGKRKNQSEEVIDTVFTYIEYKDLSNSARFICLETAKQPEHNARFFQQLATLVKLENISDNHTRSWLEKCLSV